VFRGSVLLLALLLSGQVLWTSLVDHQISVGSALVRLLIAMPVAATMLGVLRLVTARTPDGADRDVEQRSPADR